MDHDLPKNSWRRGTPFRLGDLEIHPESGEVRSRRGVERLRPLLVDVLLRLAVTPGEVVRRETLLEEVWSRRMVNDEVLSRAIAELRTALGDDARQARYIETLPKIGYRLVAPVEPLVRPASILAEAGTHIAPPPAVGLPPPRRSAAAPWIGGAIVGAILFAAAFVLSRSAPGPSDLERRIAAARPFASDPALEIAPRFSPDGSRVAFVLGEGNRSQIVIQGIDGQDRRTVGEEGGLYHSPVFFPDGKRLAYWRARGNDCAIVEHDLATGESRALLDCKRRPRARFDLSPDGTRIAFSGTIRPQYPWGLVLLDLRTGEQRDLTMPEPGMGDDSIPRFSPDGKRIAYFHGNESHRQLWIADLETGTQRAAAKPEGLAYGAAWLGPNGPLLVAADWFGFRALNLVDLPTASARLLGARGARFPDVSARGDIVYENAMYSANLWHVDLAAGTARKLWPSTRYSSQPQVSPDGRRIAFASNREGDDAIYVGSPGAELRRLPLPAGYRYLRPRWSADGQRIYAVRATVGGGRTSSAVRIDVDRGTHEALTALGNDVVEVRESADGKSLYYGEAAALAMRVLRTSAERPAQGERLALPTIVEFQIAGDMLVFTQPQLMGLTRCRLPALDCERFEAAVDDGNRFAWTLTKKAVLYRDAAGAIQRYDFAQRKAEPVKLPGVQGTIDGISAFPGEGAVVVTAEERLAIDLMLAR